jgi:hypothetical protein
MKWIGGIVGTILLGGLCVGFCWLGVSAAVALAHAIAAGDPARIARFVPAAVAFSLLGFGLLASLPFGWKWWREEERQRQEHPGAPWMWQRDWASKRIVCSRVQALLAAWVPTSLFSVIFGSVAVAALLDHRVRGTVTLLPPLVFLTAFAWLFGAVPATWRCLRKDWPATLSLAKVPCVPGQCFEAELEIGRPLLPAEGCEATLACLEGIRGVFAKRHRWLWHQTQKRLPAVVTGGRTRVTVSIDIPAGAVPTDPERKIEWHLTVRAGLKGPDFEADFEVPVFPVS